MAQITTSDSTRQRPNWLAGGILILLLGIFLFGFAYAGLQFFGTVRSIALNTPQFLRGKPESVSQESKGVVVAGAEGAGQKQPVVAQPKDPLNDLLGSVLIKQKQEPINILLLGVDTRQGKDTSLNTDTMILVTIDVDSGSVGMLSLPRDLWIPIPGHGESRINTAYSVGESREKGGGPALVKQTVSELIGQPVDYYVRINFDGFRTLLEEVGCLEITVPYDIDDPEFPDDNYGFDPFFIAAGDYCLDADMALKYARTRHADSDFGRMDRQQQVLLAMKDKLLSSGQVAHLLGNMSSILETLSDSLQTDIPLLKQIKLGNMALRLDLNNIRRLIIDDKVANAAILEDKGGAWVLIPDEETFRAALDEFFYPVGVEEVDIVQQKSLTEENAHISVLNGTATPEMAEQVAAWLATQGFTVVNQGLADHAGYAQTEIRTYGNKPLTLQKLTELLGVIDEAIKPGTNTEAGVDIEIVVGSDIKLY